MKLTKYIDDNRLDRREFADKCGVDPISLYRWENGLRTPRGKYIIAIMRETKGKVTANDFIEAVAA